MCIRDSSLTDETYALLSSARAPAGVEEHDYYFAVSMLDHSYCCLLYTSRCV